MSFNSSINLESFGKTKPSFRTSKRSVSSKRKSSSKTNKTKRSTSKRTKKKLSDYAYSVSFKPGKTNIDKFFKKFLLNHGFTVKTVEYKNKTQVRNVYDDYVEWVRKTLPSHYVEVLSQASLMYNNFTVIELWKGNKIVALAMFDRENFKYNVELCGIPMKSKNQVSIFGGMDDPSLGNLSWIPLSLAMLSRKTNLVIRCDTSHHHEFHSFANELNLPCGTLRNTKHITYHVPSNFVVSYLMSRMRRSEHITKTKNKNKSKSSSRRKSK